MAYRVLVASAGYTLKTIGGGPEFVQMMTAVQAGDRASFDQAWESVRIQYVLGISTTLEKDWLIDTPWASELADAMATQTHHRLVGAVDEARARAARRSSRSVSISSTASSISTTSTVSTSSTSSTASTSSNSSMSTSSLSTPSNRKRKVGQEEETAHKKQNSVSEATPTTEFKIREDKSDLWNAAALLVERGFRVTQDEEEEDQAEDFDAAVQHMLKVMSVRLYGKPLGAAECLTTVGPLAGYYLTKTAQGQFKSFSGKSFDFSWRVGAPKDICTGQPKANKEGYLEMIGFAWGSTLALQNICFNRSDRRRISRCDRCNYTPCYPTQDNTVVCIPCMRADSEAYARDPPTFTDLSTTEGMHHLMMTLSEMGIAIECNPSEYQDFTISTNFTGLKPLANFDLLKPNLHREAVESVLNQPSG